MTASQRTTPHRVHYPGFLGNPESQDQRVGPAACSVRMFLTATVAEPRGGRVPVGGKSDGNREAETASGSERKGPSMATARLCQLPRQGHGKQQ